MLGRFDVLHLELLGAEVEFTWGEDWNAHKVAALRGGNDDTQWLFGVLYFQRNPPGVKTVKRPIETN